MSNIRDFFGKNPSNSYNLPTTSAEDQEYHSISRPPSAALEATPELDLETASLSLSSDSSNEVTEYVER